MTALAVIGNISRDIAVYPEGRRHALLGGAALHVARAAARAGLAAAPISVIGSDLGWIRGDPRLRSLDLSYIKEVPGQSCSFRLRYTTAGELVSVECSYGVAESVTDHCLRLIGHHERYHICCRRPLEVGAVLRRLATAGLTFTVDFHLASAAELIRAAAPFLAHSAAVFVNAAEFAALTAVIDPRRLAAVVVSDGPSEAVVLRQGRTTASSRPPRTLPVEVTGAGDTLAGTFLAGVAQGLGDADALEAATVAAAHSVGAADLTMADA
jgi:sugar/nucleoside kinase (ribokinase family)